MKPLYFSLGWIFFTIGLIAILVPVLPTTPFMILALWGFSKSSVRFHNWLYHHRLFGPTLQLWDKYQVIPLFVKIVALFFMSMSLLYLIFFSGIHFWIIVAAGIFMLIAATYILSKPSKCPSEDSHIN